MPTPAASVIIPAYNAAATIAACLDALLAQRLPPEMPPLEIIVVDDGSRDATAAIAAHYAPAVRLLRQANAGPAAARNTGLAVARAPLVLFTDADCEPLPDWATTLIAGLTPPVVGVRGTYRTRQRSLVARFVQLEYEDKYDRMAREPRIDFIDTYAAGYRREVITALGGFNPALRYNEDQELSYRVAAAGGEMRFVPAAQVVHQHAATLTAYARKKFHIGTWKVVVHTAHPGALVRDSHTPQSQKLQMGLAGGIIGAGLGGLVWRPLWRVAGFGLAVFAASAGPFTLKALRRDPAVGLVAPGLLAVRALALGCGFAWGLIRAGRLKSLHVGRRHPRPPGEGAVPTPGKILRLSRAGGPLVASVWPRAGWPRLR
jgi:GT2 family glycosyltransferase